MYVGINEVVKSVCDMTGVNKRLVKPILEALLNTIVEECQKGSVITLNGFGVFNKVITQPTKAINPRTREVIDVTVKSTLRFMPSLVVKQEYTKTLTTEEVELDRINKITKVKL